MAESEDQELMNLLGKAPPPGVPPIVEDKLPPSTPPIPPSPPPPKVQPIKITAKDIMEVPPIVEPVLAAPVKSTELNPNATLNKEPQTLQKEENTDFNQLVSLFSKRVGKIMKNQDDIREKTLKDLDLLDKKLKATIDNKPNIAVVQGWVAMHQTLADMDGNSTAVLDSIARLISAAKKNDLLISAGGDVKLDGDSLVDILNQNRFEDEQQ